MGRMLTAAAAVLVLAACGGKGAEQAAQDTTRSDLELAPSDSGLAMNDQPAPAGQAAPAPAPTPPPASTPAPTPKPKPAAPSPSSSAPAAPAMHTYSLAAGTMITTAATDSLHSRHNKAGESFHASVSADVKDAKGNVVIPAGSVITFNVVALEPAKNKSDSDGRVRLDAKTVTIDGKDYAISGTVPRESVEHVLEGQGVTAGGAARVAGGAAAGAIGGKVVGGKTGAIVGGIAGAAGGAVLASKTADRDVVVRPGMKVTLALGTDLTLTR